MIIKIAKRGEVIARALAFAPGKTQNILAKTFKKIKPERVVKSSREFKEIAENATKGTILNSKSGMHAIKNGNHLIATFNVASGGLTR